MKQPDVILVDKNDQPIGTAEKLEAHQKNWLHRAFSVLLYRHHASRLEVLLQQRQSTKYHCPNLWSNTCCSHPQPGENCLDSAIKRLDFELNITFTQLSFVSKFYYQHTFSPDLHEHELDYVYVGYYDESLPMSNPDEVAQLVWYDYSELLAAVEHMPQRFTPWLKAVLTLAKPNMESDK
ncbi:MAG: isopentenyl-diphosphate delta-isomerase [Legionellales bacterium]|nr:isopentenyl-diphosphate delta-isomerase [Legionellales bacterium]|tara:strand:- start:655 stop:1194 length:540 start_codon:yes stop_codon:yes gene_type:complete